MLSVLIYAGIFIGLAALVLGITAWFIRRTDWGFAGIIIPFLILAALGVAVLIGVAAVLITAIVRGQFLPVFLSVLAIAASLTLAWQIYAAIKRPVWRAQEEVRRHLAKARQVENRFLEDYGRFLKAAANGNTETVREMLDWGMPFYAPSPKATPRYDQAWVEAIARRADVTGISIFGYTALELAAWYGHTEIVALLLAREREVPGRADRHRFALHQAEKFGHSAAAALLREVVTEASTS